MLLFHICEFVLFVLISDLIAILFLDWTWAPLAKRSSWPAVLSKSHSDYPVFLRWIPRSLMAWVSTARPPVKIFGNATSPKPIPAPGQWALFFPWCFVWQTKKGRYVRAALWRWDDVDNYYELLSFAWRHYQV